MQVQYRFIFPEDINVVRIHPYRIPIGVLTRIEYPLSTTLGLIYMGVPPIGEKPSFVPGMRDASKLQAPVVCV